MNGDSMTPVWERADHWISGDSALWIFRSTNGVYERPIIIVSPAGAIVCDPEVTYNGGIFTLSEGFRDVRHRNSCELCTPSVEALRRRGEHTAVSTWDSREGGRR